HRVENAVRARGRTEPLDGQDRHRCHGCCSGGPNENFAPTPLHVAPRLTPASHLPPPRILSDSSQAASGQLKSPVSQPAAGRTMREHLPPCTRLIEGMKTQPENSVP